MIYYIYYLFDFAMINYNLINLFWYYYLKESGLINFRLLFIYSKTKEHLMILQVLVITVKMKETLKNLLLKTIIKTVQYIIDDFKIYSECKNVTY